MEVVISDHLQRKNYLLLKPQLLFKRNDREIVYEDEIYSGLNFDEYISLLIYFKEQYIFFSKNLPGNDKLLRIKVFEDEDNCRRLDYSRGRINFSSMYGDLLFVYVLFNRSIIINISDKIIDRKSYNFVITKGKIIVININDDALTVGILDNKIRIIVDGNEIILTDITASVIQDFIELYRKEKAKKNILADLTLEINEDKSIKRYGTTLDNKKEGFFYESDVSGGLEISSYLNDKLHGYYFNRKTEEQGFYENGIKVGFWKEQGKIINYDKRDRIFFVFPVFFS